MASCCPWRSARARRRAETLELRRPCAPSHSIVAALRQAGFQVVAQWLSDDGWPIERWSDGGKGEALVVLAQADDGSVLRCRLLARSPRGEKS